MNLKKKEHQMPSWMLSSGTSQVQAPLSDKIRQTKTINDFKNDVRKCICNVSFQHAVKALFII